MDADWEQYQSAGEAALKEGDYPAAEVIWRAAYQKARSFKKYDARVSITLEGLAEALWHQGKFYEAEVLVKHTLEIFQVTRGPEHQDVAVVCNNLAMLFHFQGKYSEAEPMYKQALEIMSKLLGSDHPDVIAILTNYSDLLRVIGRLAEADQMRSEALTHGNLTQSGQFEALQTNTADNLTTAPGDELDELPFLEQQPAPGSPWASANAAEQVAPASMQQALPQWSAQAPEQQAPPQWNAPVPEQQAPPQWSAPVPEQQAPPQWNAPVPQQQAPPQWSAPVPEQQAPPQWDAQAPEQQAPPQWNAPVPEPQAPPQWNAPAPEHQAPPQWQAPAPEQQAPPQWDAQAPEQQAPPQWNAPVPEQQAPSEWAPPAAEHAAEAALQWDASDAEQSQEQAAPQWIPEPVPQEVAKPVSASHIAEQFISEFGDISDHAASPSPQSHASSQASTSAETPIAEAPAHAEFGDGAPVQAGAQPSGVDHWTELRAQASDAVDSGDFTSAERLWQEAIREAQSFTGHDPRLPISLEGLAAAYWKQGKFDQAEQLTKRCFNIYETVLGPEHDDVGVVANNLAMLYHAQGKLQLAEGMYKRSLPLRARSLGNQHPAVFNLMMNYCNVLVALDRSDEAEEVKTRFADASTGRWARSDGYAGAVQGGDEPMDAPAGNDLPVLGERK